ncbi:hypothetical protein [Marinibacterium sp. SX1]|uniref:hypothetical protein n=1 Tax=Marinibacterium sp. SX1 TaxID=3388424 RepID=UPI003D17C582
MKPILPLSLLLVAGACAPLATYYKPGVEVARLETDTTNCQVTAAQEVPPNNQIRSSPAFFYPSLSYCGGGGCFYGNPYWADSYVYTIDVNEPLRRKVTEQCMGEKGYAPVRIPMCPVGISVPPGRTERLPVLTPDSCAVRNSDGSFQIVELR